MTDVMEIQKRSVTAGDAAERTPAGTTALSVVIGPAALQWGGLLDGIKGATGLPRHGSKARDAILSGTPLLENMWGSAVNAAITKQTSIGFRLEDAEDSERRVRNAQALMLGLGGDYVDGLARHLHDYLLTDNGAFVEVVRASGGAGARIIGLMPLDSLRCWRTGDPGYPVVYVDLKGQYHRLDAENVLLFADMPSPRVEHRGLGLCAASRAFETILKLSAIETYIREKVSGSRNLAIHFITGVNPASLNDALNGAAENQARKGFVVYKGSTIIPMLGGAGGEAPQLITIPLAEIPDGFSADEERRDSYLRYANALGVPVQEIQPLSGQGLGTGTQSVILDEAADGRGLAQWRRQWQQAITHRVLPAATTFYLATNDIRAKKDQAGVFSTMASAVTALVEKQLLPAAAGLNVLVDMGLLNRAYLPHDQTPGAAVNDTDKPEGDAAQAGAQPTTTPTAAPAPQPAAPAVAAKARRITLPDIDDALLAAAAALRDEVKG